MKLIWSRAKSHDPICFFLDEPVSHVALCFFDCIVFHSTFVGVDILSLDDFRANRQIIYDMEYPVTYGDEHSLLTYVAMNQTTKRYDWAFFWWLLRQAFIHKIFRKPLPEKIQTQSRAHILCTEILDLLPDGIAPVYDRSKAVTPYRLYLLLENAQWPFFRTSRSNP